MRVSLKYKAHIPKKYEKIDKLRCVLIQRGNKERANSFVFSLCQALKIASNPIHNHTDIGNFMAKNPINTLGEKNPFNIIDRCLFKLMPAFNLKNTVVAGKLYRLPIPISDNRAAYLATSWLRKAAIADNKNAFTVPYLLAREVGAVLNDNGSACKSLSEFIDIALDQRPFSRYLWKKRKIIGMSKKGKPFRRLKKQHKLARRVINRRNGRKRYRARFQPTRKNLRHNQTARQKRLRKIQARKNKRK